MGLRAAQICPALHPGALSCPQPSPGAPPRGDAAPTARQPTLQTTLSQDLYRGPPRLMEGEPCQRWKANAETSGVVVADMDIGTTYQQAVAVAARPVRTWELAVALGRGRDDVPPAVAIGPPGRQRGADAAAHPGLELPHPCADTLPLARACAVCAQPLRRHDSLAQGPWPIQPGQLGSRQGDELDPERLERVR